MSRKSPHWYRSSHDFTTTQLSAAQTKQDEQAPIPAQIVAAKKVFIANGGGDDPGMPDPLFSGGSDRPYNQFYASLKSSGKYELVGSPAEADLLFEIRFSVVPQAAHRLLGR